MPLKIGNVVCGIFLCIANITLVEALDYPSLDEALPRGGNTAKYAPVFDFAFNSCYPGTGISRDGIINPGLHPSGSITGGCQSPYFLNISNTLHRYACIASGGSDYCGHFYALYFEKDQCVIPYPLCGHRHDWEYAAVWTIDGALVAASVSHHGDVTTLPITWPALSFQDGHIRIVYLEDGLTTHVMGFAGQSLTARNPYGIYVTPPLISWYELTGDGLSNKQMRDLLNSFNYGAPDFPDGGGTIPVKDAGDRFLNNLNAAKPPNFPSFTQASIEAANPSNPVLAFVAGDGSFSMQGGDYVIDFGQVPAGRRGLPKQWLIAEFAIRNDVSEPAESLDGEFDTTRAAPYLLTGFDPFTALAVGDFITGNVVEISTAGYPLGLVTGEIEFQPKGLVDTGAREFLDPITLRMNLEIVPSPDNGGNFFGCTITRDPMRQGFDPTLILVTMIAFIYVGMRRRNAPNS